MKKILPVALAACAFLNAYTADIDPDTRVGVLDNGLTFYIRHNDNPAGTADYFLAQKVGSVYEDDDQRGLAHFLEHMCFNGTDHFPGNSLITYLESIGVKFGAHLNAYTSTDETVYNICKAPVARTSTVDSCLMILRDWSCGLLLNPADIDAERGVIVNEWRQRNSATNRMLEKASPDLYGGTAYGYRLPIGQMEVVENFKPEVLRRFYDRWNVPANQAVIVTGDIDVDAVEKQVRTTFGSIPARRSPLSQKAVRPAVPVADSLVAVVRSDAEQGSEMLQLYWRMPYDDSVEARVMADIVAALLVERFDAIENSSDYPYFSLAIGKTKFFMAGGEQAFTMRGPVKAGRAADAARLWAGEMFRAARLGFTPAEIEKAKEKARTDAAEKLRASKSENNTMLARRAVRHFLDGGNSVSPEESNRLTLAAIDAVDAHAVARWLNALPSDGGMVILNYTPVGDTSDAEREQLLRRTVAEAREASYTPFSVGTSATAAALPVSPSEGRVVAVDSLAEFGAVTYTLSNGIRVIAKHTDYKPGQVYVRGFRPGGLSLTYRAADVPTLRVVNELMAEMKYGGLTSSEIRNILAGRQVKASVSVSNYEESLETATTADDLEVALQLLYLRATGFEPDSLAFKRFIDGQRNNVAHRRLNPTQAMGDSIHHNIYSRHPLAARQNADDVEHIDLDAAFKLYHSRFDNMDGFTYMIVGDYPADSIVPLMERYIASLPKATGALTAPVDINYTYTPYDFDLRFGRAMENPQGIVYSFYSGDADYSLANALNATVAGQLLRSRLMADLRENRGWTYSIKTHAAVNTGLSIKSGAKLMMPTYIKVTPGREQETLDVVNANIATLADEANISADDVAAIKEYLRKNFAEMERDNAYWLRVFKLHTYYGYDTHNPYLDAVDAITPATVAAFVRNTILPANKASIILLPTANN